MRGRRKVPNQEASPAAVVPAAPAAPVLQPAPVIAEPIRATAAPAVAVREWKRPDQMEVPEHLKNPDFGFKWARKDEIDKAIAEGWEVARGAGGTLDYKPYQSGQSLDGAVHLREMVLVRMPKAMVGQRNDYYRKINDDRMKSVKKGAEMKQQIEKANKDANVARGTRGESFVASHGKVSASGMGTGLEPMLDEKQVEDDLKSLK